MVSAISLCLLAVGLSAVSSQLLSADDEFSEAPTSDRRSFKHGKPLKVLSFGKKHKKFAGFIPYVFGRTPCAEIPVIHEAPKPFYKVHRYPGVEVKPSSDVSFSTPEPFVETHSVEPPSGDFASAFGPDHDHSFPPSSAVVYSEYKPVFSQPPPAHASLPPAKPIFSFVPAPQPVFPAVPVQPIFASVPVFRPAPIPSLPEPAPVLTHVPPAQPIFPIKFQPQVIQAPSPVFPVPSPAPVFQPIPIKIPAPVLPPLPAPSSPPVLVKIPTRVIPSLSVPPPGLVLPVVSSTPAPVFPSFPVSLPPGQIPVPSPSLPSFSALPSVSATPEPEFPYPPSGAPIPSYIKDISLGDVEIPSAPLPTAVTPNFEEVTPTIIDDGFHKAHDHLGPVKTDIGLFQKFKGWKSDKANAALGYFANFRPKPSTPLDVPGYQNLQLPGPVHSLPLAPARPIFFPPTGQFKYESFPPNNIESPPLFNSYGAPIPHDSYSSIPHDRLSSAASEEEPAVVPAPDDGKQQQQQRFLPQAVPREHPVYVADEVKTKEENKTIEDVHPEPEDYKTEKEPRGEDAASNYPNHKE